MNYFNVSFDSFVVGFVACPVVWYFAKPALVRLYNDIVGFVNPILAKVTSKQLPAI